jgi:MFS family permease
MQPAAPAPGSAPAPVPLRRNPGFRLLWIGQVLSDTGTSAALIAYPLLILALTHSAVIAGVVGTVRLVVELLLGLPGGALADRFDRRLTLIACDTVRAFVLALLAGLVLAHLVSWPIVLVVAAIDGAGAVLFDPAVSAAMPVVVADEQLETAWAATEGRSYAASLAGPAIGGALFSLGSALPFIGDAVSYAISVGTVSRIRGRFRPQRTGEGTSLWREAVDGIRLVWKHPLLRAVVVQAPLVNFAFSGVIFTITLALRRYGTAPAIIGLAQAGISAGGLLGALIAPRLQQRLPLSKLVVVLTVSATMLFVAAAATLPSTLVALPIAVTFVLAPAANAGLFAAMTRAAPPHMRGRVNSTVILAATALAALSPLTAGLLVERTSGRWALLAFAAVMAVAAVLIAALPGLRQAEAAAAAEAANPAPPVQLADPGSVSG